jgi:hypothetical protein
VQKERSCRSERSQPIRAQHFVKFSFDFLSHHGPSNSVSTFSIFPV